jgi:hypothetical protein
MIIGLVRAFLGPLAPVLDFIENQPGTVAIILLFWFGIYWAGRLQLKHIEKKTVELVIISTQKELAKHPNLSVKGLYKRIYPEWEKSLPEWGGWFIPHRSDLWPVPIRVKTVQEKMSFSPEWIAKVLLAYKISVEGKD